MGVVLLARDTALEIPVAIKLLPDAVVKDTEAVADLRREVLRGIALTHPGIVRTHNFERDQSGAAIVMEYVNGSTLIDLKTQQPDWCFDPSQVIPWLEHLCEALDYAHREARIVHRDLKPGNLMITRAGRLKIADFGIAATLADSISRHSVQGSVSGTLSYMSPQQAEGRRPTHLDDIHALGATIYELLTGKPPFFRGNPAMILTQVISMVPPTMRERRNELEIWGRTPIPAVWEDAVAACLAKDPTQRPQSALEVLNLLKASRFPDVSGMTTTVVHAPATTTVTPSVPQVVSESEQLKIPNLLQLVQDPKKTPRSSRVRSWNPHHAFVIAIVAIIVLSIWINAKQAAETRASESRRLNAFYFGEGSLTPVNLVVKASPLGTVTVATPFVNSLGMKFVPVPGTSVLFSVWETRRQDYSLFIKETQRAWPKASFLQDGNHPAVNVNWMDAVAFCTWLSKREGRPYRLPTDGEWSLAAGLQNERGRTPRDKDERAEGFPWGREWPPPAGVGNFADGAARRAKSAPAFNIRGYQDGYPYTSPVGVFRPNGLMIYDMAGNVLEWCEDRYDQETNSRVLRGGSWGYGESAFLKSSYRNYEEGNTRREDCGFRCVLELSGGSARATEQ